MWRHRHYVNDDAAPLVDCRKQKFVIDYYTSTSVTISFTKVVVPRYVPLREARVGILGDSPGTEISFPAPLLR